MGTIDTRIHYTDSRGVRVGVLRARHQLVNPIGLLGGRFQRDQLSQFVRPSYLSEVIEHIEGTGQLFNGGLCQHDHSIGEAEGVPAQTDACVLGERLEPAGLVTVASPKPYLPPHHGVGIRELIRRISPELLDGGEADRADPVHKVPVPRLVLYCRCRVFLQAGHEVSERAVGQEDRGVLHHSCGGAELSDGHQLRMWSLSPRIQRLQS